MGWQGVVVRGQALLFTLTTKWVQGTVIGMDKRTEVAAAATDGDIRLWELWCGDTSRYSEGPTRFVPTGKEMLALIARVRQEAARAERISDAKERAYRQIHALSLELREAGPDG